MKTTAALIACLALALPVAAQTADDIASVTRQAQILEQVTESGDIGASLKLLPPTLLDRNAEAQGMSRAEFDAMMTESMAQLAGISKVRDSSIATPDMVWHSLPDGTLFATIPTRNIVEVTLEPGKAPMLIEETSATLALKDQGEWRVVRAGSNTQQETLRRAFPWLEGVDLSEAKTEVLDQ